MPENWSQRRRYLRLQTRRPPGVGPEAPGKAEGRRRSCPERAGWGVDWADADAIGQGCSEPAGYFVFCFPYLLLNPGYLASRLNLTRVSSGFSAQTVKPLPTMRETWVRFLGWEDLLEKEMATHSAGSQHEESHL
ncbi:hypothetical protein R6Z07M_016200 [Ovis aries]